MTTAADKKRQQKWGVHVQYSQMQPQVQKQAKHVICHAIENRSNEQDMAQQIKKYMDKKFGTGWLAIVGRQFGINVTHDQGSFLKASKGPLQIVIMRCSS